MGVYDDEEVVVRVYDFVVFKYWGFGILINFFVMDYVCDVEEM